MTRLRLSPASQTPMEVTAGLEPWIASGRTGLVGDLVMPSPDAEEVRDAAGVTTVNGRLVGGRVVGSTSFDPAVARVRALGEVAERYANVAAERWVRLATMSTTEALARGAADPRRLALPSPGELVEYPDFGPLDPEAPIAWVEGWRLVPGSDAPDPTLLPAEAALAHYKPPPPSRRFAWASSSGSGTGNTLEEALRSGLREVLERDAFATTWLLRRPVPHIDLDRVADPDVARWRDHHRRAARSPSLLWLTTDIGFPVVAAQVLDPRGPGRYVLGFGASTDPARAMRRAVEEAEQGRLLLKHLFRTGAPIPADATDTRSLEAQIMYWQDPSRHGPLGFLLDAPRHVDPRALQDLSAPAPYHDVQTIVGLLGKRGLDAFFVDVTPPEFRGRLPLRVAATLVPGAQPIRMGDKPPCLQNARLGRPWHTLNALPPPFA